MDFNASEVVYLIYVEELANYCQMAVAAVLMYDMIITLDKVQYFWPFSSNSANALYLLLRFGSIIGASTYIYLTSARATNLICNLDILLTPMALAEADLGVFAAWTINLLDLTTLLCVDYILYLRVRSMYSLETRFKRVITFIQVLFAINTVIMLGSLISGLVKDKVSRHEITADYGVCSVRNVNTDLRILIWAAPLTYECILMGLALYKAAEIRTSLGLRGMKLLKMIVRDQVLYFVAAMVCGIVKLISGMGLEETAPSWLVFSQVFGTTRLLAPLGVRMLIHQKEAAENKPEASFMNPSDISMAQFRSQEWVEDPVPVGSTGSIVRSDSALGPTDSHDAP